jgi:hypothetical protein
MVWRFRATCVCVEVDGDNKRVQLTWLLSTAIGL